MNASLKPPVWPLEMPSEDGPLASWLEDRVLGTELGEVVAQLQVFVDGLRALVPAEKRADSTVPLISVADWPEATRISVLDRGLSVLDHAALISLIRKPDELFELQILALSQVDGYWAERFESLDTKESQGSPRFIESAGIPIPTADPISSVPPTTRPTASKRIYGLLSLAAAIVLTVTASWYFLTPPVDPVARDWGWDRPEVIDARTSPSNYLRSLAVRAEDWFRTDRSNRIALGTRLREFRHACDSIQAAEHPALNATDRAWLVERCRAWREKISEQIRLLDSETVSTEVVLKSTDEIVTKLVTALRLRADELS